MSGSVRRSTADCLERGERLGELANGLRRAGQEVIETPFDAVDQCAGAFRCWHHTIVRESVL